MAVDGAESEAAVGIIGGTTGGIKCVLVMEGGGTIGVNVGGRTTGGGIIEKGLAAKDASTVQGP